MVAVTRANCDKRAARTYGSKKPCRVGVACGLPQGDIAALLE